MGGAEAIGPVGIRPFPPRITQHMAASWLVQDGVPLYNVQAFAGHEDYATTQQYAHVPPDALSKVMASWLHPLTH
jgi:site-specific recombinase XerD